MEILVATHNQHKKEEIQQILPDYNITSLTDYNLLKKSSKMAIVLKQMQK